ncbi:hypothetical protein JIQ42_07219 [Leishmania sp. Namibia]|uniref:hypothetical protein n=1 Tax=Leishmania sp. Namibia TaxID=2802991 RepID=UPI001B3F2620|nr:hypothetical protein JIQ42_07219 [Leishmania sp. Namibia]
MLLATHSVLDSAPLLIPFPSCRVSSSPSSAAATSLSADVCSCALSLTYSPPTHGCKRLDRVPRSQKVREFSSMRATPRYPPAHQPTPTAYRDMRKTHSYACTAPGRQAPSADYGHDATRRSVPGRGKGQMSARDGTTRSSSSNVKSTLACRAHTYAPTAASAVSMPQPSSPPPPEHKSVVYTLQNTTTDTLTHETAYGGVLTIRTTTVTRTITERLVASDEDDDSSEDGQVRVKEEHDE